MMMDVAGKNLPIDHFEPRLYRLDLRNKEKEFGKMVVRTIVDNGKRFNR